MTLYEKINRNRDVQFFKEHSAFFILLPTLLAGLKQSLILLLLNRNVLTFFSVTQLVSDGIVLTSIFVLLVLFSFLYKLFVQKYIKNRFYLRLIEYFTMIIGFGLLAVSKYFILENYAYLIMFICVIIFIYTSLILYRDLLFKSIMYLMMIVSVIGLNIMTSVDPNKEIRNIKLTSGKIKNKYPLSHLLYYNDQYLFYSTENKFPNEEIIVVKMEDIFNKDFEAQ